MEEVVVGSAPGGSTGEEMFLPNVSFWAVDRWVFQPVPGQKSRRGAVMKVKDVIRLLEGEGWFLVATRGSHRQYKHPVRPGRVTVAGKPSDDLAPGTFNSILKQSGLKE
jgi:predicted RNA binding protein YcfA (HicA-like mRNA interferase family)